MCYVGSDREYVLREMEDRMKGVAFQVDKSEEPGHIPLIGLLVRLRAIFQRERQKDLMNG